MFDNQFTVQQTSSSEVRGFDAGLKAHMQRIYNRMTMGVLVTAIISYVVGNSPALLSAFLGGPQAYVIMLAPLAIVFFGFNPAKMSANAMRVSFFALSALYGISFAAIFQVFTGESIAKAFFVATSMFAGLSLYGYTTQKDLSGLGSFAIMGVWGVLILGLINLFFHSTGMANLISVVAIIAFAGLTAWETQSLKEMYSARADGEYMSRMSWLGAFNLYISFIAMFQHILQLMGDRR
jgi:FtsH-binding integral membrane protein